VKNALAPPCFGTFVDDDLGLSFWINEELTVPNPVRFCVEQRFTWWAIFVCLIISLLFMNKNVCKNYIFIPKIEIKHIFTPEN